MSKYCSYDLIKEDDPMAPDERDVWKLVSKCGITVKGKIKTTWKYCPGCERRIKGNEKG